MNYLNLFIKKQTNIKNNLILYKDIKKSILSKRWVLVEINFVSTNKKHKKSIKKTFDFYMQMRYTHNVK